KDLAALNTSVDALLADLKVPGAPGDLQERLTALSSKMTARSKECKALDSKSHLDRGNEYSKKILDIRNRIANDIHEFTFYGSTSIEMLIKDMGQTGIGSSLFLNNGAVNHIYNQFGVLMGKLTKCLQTKTSLKVLQICSISMLLVKLALGMI
ncbi:hypothetical protein B0H11DRAFT_2116275, partial [Mycena galericulata]